MADTALELLLSQVRTGKSIPGCSLATVVPGLIQAEFGGKIRSIEDPEERAQYQKDLEGYYLRGEGKSTIEKIIRSMEYHYNVASTVISQVSTTASAMTAMNLIPSTLVTGSAAGVANTLWVTPHNFFLKGSLTTQLMFGKQALGDLIEESLLVHFDISSIATGLIAAATTAEAVINAIV